jgi:hypothetical protein
LDQGFCELEQRYGRSHAPPGPDSRAAIHASRLGLHIFTTLSILMMLCVMAMARDPSGQVALVYMPGTTLAASFMNVVAAGGRPVRAGRFRWIIVAAAAPGDSVFPARAHAQGALAVLSPWVAGNCATASPAFAPAGRR